MKKIVIDFTSYDSKQAFHEDIAAKLGFPSYYGCNLDALHDMMAERVPEACDFEFIYGGCLPESFQNVVARILKGE